MHNLLPTITEFLTKDNLKLILSIVAIITPVVLFLFNRRAKKKGELLTDLKEEFIYSYSIYDPDRNKIRSILNSKSTKEVINEIEKELIRPNSNINGEKVEKIQKKLRKYKKYKIYFLK